MFVFLWFILVIMFCTFIFITCLCIIYTCCGHSVINIENTTHTFIDGLIALSVLAFLPAHENGHASFKSNKAVPKRSCFFAVLVLPPIFTSKNAQFTICNKLQ